MCDLRRHLGGIPTAALREKTCDTLVLTGLLLPQKSKDKLYRARG